MARYPCLCFVSAVFVGLILLLFQWPFSQTFMIALLGWGIGLGITIFLKMLLTMCCRAAQYRAFYRIRPGGARISSLALECWFIGVAGSIVLGRVAQFLLAAAFWVGRIDTRFLSEDVVSRLTNLLRYQSIPTHQLLAPTYAQSVFGYSFDYVPLYFTKDLLVHEAHRVNNPTLCAP